ncbi:hypothetical protein NDU88_001562 [Pleurodeles waltl]|uniref:Uncharacterized protein n=1 Tax=Pleurodeles waltl TaxID=8319 RepID=A0AAV7SBY7_PLEWA|nr:hypothetical protein NDU88_001562 [Pleurodeles waltl]
MLRSRVIKQRENGGYGRGSACRGGASRDRRRSPPLAPETHRVQCCPMRLCAADCDRLPPRCATLAQLPHFTLSHFTGQAAAISRAHMASFLLRHTWLGLAPTIILAIQSREIRVLGMLWALTCGLLDSVLHVVLPRHRPLGLARRRRNLPVYRPLVDLSTMEERHVILTYRLNRATIQELCAQLEPDLMSPIRQPTGIPPLVQVLSVLHFLASG